MPKRPLAEQHYASVSAKYIDKNQNRKSFFVRRITKQQLTSNKKMKKNFHLIHKDTNNLVNVFYKSKH